MSELIIEFNNFLQNEWNLFSDNEKKLANIIVNNFRNISQKGSAAGARSKLLSDLIQKQGKFVSNDLPNDFKSSVEQPKIKKLHELVVRNFRGFTEEKKFDLSKKYTFLYGLNGTGKSSFTEALEYCLTGEIFESESKGFDIDKYIQNKRTKERFFTSLNIENEDGIISYAQKNLASNKFIFIERNRIEGFARVSSYTPKIQQQQLAALFGLDEFNSFCKGFNLVDSLNNNLPLKPVKEERLIAARNNIKGAEAIINSEVLKAEGYKERRNNLLGKYPDCSLVSEVKVKIEGNDSNIGLLSAKKKELEDIKSTIEEKPVSKLDELLSKTSVLKLEYNQYVTLKAEIDKYKDSLSLVDLYNAISNSSSNVDNDFCPACKTPIANTVVNPFKNADDELIKLKYYSQKQTEVSNKLSSLKSNLTKIQTQLDFYQILNTASLDSLDNDLEKISKEVSELRNNWDAYNQENKTKLEAIKNIESEILCLEQDKEEAGNLYELYNASHKEKKKQEKIISDFNSDNERLIKEVEEEKELIFFYKTYSVAYESFIKKLNGYSASLPSKLIAGLEALTLQFYNSINEHPYNHEVLISLKLPKTPSEKIEIEYLDGSKDDALRVLSEGHLRCLGLSILLAKNVHDDHNVIIFDDVVNAIDDEHRSNVINTFFHNSHLIEKQIVITTHGEDFLKNLENKIAKKDLDKLLKRYDFLENRDSRSIIVEPDLNRHYLSQAETNLKKGFKRNCLVECRHALEELAPKLWKNIAKENSLNSAVSVQLRQPNGIPELASVVDGLISCIKKFESLKIDKFTSHKEILEKIKNAANKNPIFWNLLNKGTHEEERNEEFDQNSISELLENLLKLEELLKPKRT